MTDLEAIASFHDRHIGARLAHLRRQSGQSIEEISGVIGITDAQYALLESGAERTTSRQLLTLSQHYEVAMVYFFEGVFQIEGVRKQLELVGRAAVL